MSPKSEKQYGEIRDATKAKIESSAIALFSKSGLSVTIGEIARHAKISQGLIYRYYPSKDALVEALVDRAILSSSDAICSVWDEKISAQEKVKKISLMMMWMLQSPKHVGAQLFLFMIQVGMNMSQPSIIEKLTTDANKPMVDLSKIIEQGQVEGSVKDGTPFSLAMIYWAAVQGLCCYSLTGLSIPNEPNILSGILLK